MTVIEEVALKIFPTALKQKNKIANTKQKLAKNSKVSVQKFLYIS